MKHPHLPQRVAIRRPPPGAVQPHVPGGGGFEPESVPDPSIDEKLRAERKRGWGLKLMKSLSDDFRIESNTTGTKIIIRKLLR